MSVVANKFGWKGCCDRERTGLLSKNTDDTMPSFDILSVLSVEPVALVLESDEEIGRKGQRQRMLAK